MNKSLPNALIVFLRAPELGKVKTRVAQTTGDVKALEIYKQLITITLSKIDPDSFKTYLYFHPEIDETLLPPNSEARVQSGTDLGDRMQRAFRETLEKHDHVVIIGTDCPYLTPNLIKNAFRTLKTHDAVIGPASDGGYYLLGLKKIDACLFRNIEWGTKDVLSATVSRIEEIDWSFELLETLDDVDFEDDWKRYLRRSAE